MLSYEFTFRQQSHFLIESTFPILEWRKRPTLQVLLRYSVHIKIVVPGNISACLGQLTFPLAVEQRAAVLGLPESNLRKAITGIDIEAQRAKKCRGA